MESIIFYSIILLCLLLATGLFLTRNLWLQHLTVPQHLYQRLPASFQSDLEEGFSSNTFDLNENISAEDNRAGLDLSAKNEIRRIMRKRQVDFDEARRLYMEQNFRKHDIGADGRPRDPKFVSFS